MKLKTMTAVAAVFVGHSVLCR